VTTLCLPGLIRQVRRSADLSQRELSKRSGVAISAISRIEAGRGKPRLATIERLLACTGFSLRAVDAAATDTAATDTAATDTAATDSRGPDAASIADSTARLGGADRWDDEDAARDAAGRHFPAHLDVRTPSYERPWWYYFRDTRGLCPPLLTFDLDRTRRDRYRREDGRTARDPDDRREYPYVRSRVEIPGYRPRSRYGPDDDFW